MAFSKKAIQRFRKLNFDEIFKEVLTFQDVQDCYTNNFSLLHEAAKNLFMLPEKFLEAKCLYLKRKLRRGDESTRTLLHELVLYHHPQLKKIPLEMFFQGRKNTQNALWFATASGRGEFKNKIFKWFSGKECCENLEELRRIAKFYPNDIEGKKLINTLIDRGQDYREIKTNRGIEIV